MTGRGQSSDKPLTDVWTKAEIAAAQGGGQSPPECPHGGCCESFGYVISFIEYLLDKLPKESPEWITAARIMDEVGK